MSSPSVYFGKFTLGLILAFSANSFLLNANSFFLRSNACILTSLTREWPSVVARGRIIPLNFEQ